MLQGFCALSIGVTYTCLGSLIVKVAWDQHGTIACRRDINEMASFAMNDAISYHQLSYGALLKILGRASGVWVRFPPPAQRS
jgi:hypothetical protein